MDISPLTIEFFSGEGVTADSYATFYSFFPLLSMITAHRQSVPLFTMGFTKVRGVFKMVADSSFLGDFNITDWVVLDTRAKSPSVWRV